MQSTSHKSVFKQYYLRCIIIFMLYISFVVLCIYVYPNIWSAVFCTILYFPVKILIRISANETITSVLFNDLDAQRFHQIITSNKHFRPPLNYRLNAAFFTGDYQTVVNIVSCQIQKKRCSINEKILYLSQLARVYFDLRDFEKLKLLLKKYDETKELYPSKKLFNTANTPWSYYRYFLDGNFEACKTICREKHLELNSKAWDAKIRKLNNDFAYAVACYENKEVDEAKKCFETIVSFAPNMYFSEISKKYIDSINADSKIEIFAEIVPKDDYQLFDSKTAKKTRRYRVILSILVCCTVIASSAINFISNNDLATIEFERKLNNAIAKSYDNTGFTEHFDITDTDGTQHIDCLCLIEHKNGLDLARILTHDNGETLDLELLIENLQIPYDYSIKSFAGDKQIAFSISDRQPSNSNKIIKFSLNNKDYWLEITSVTPIN